jgi:hypothetical protein
MVYAILDARYPDLHDVVKRQRIACLLTEAVKWYRAGDVGRSWRIIRNVMKDGAPLKALLVFAGLRLLRHRVATITSGMPYQRPGWINRLSRRILE